MYRKLGLQPYISSDSKDDKDDVQLAGTVITVTGDGFRLTNAFNRIDNTKILRCPLRALYAQIKKDLPDYDEVDRLVALCSPEQLMKPFETGMTILHIAILRPDVRAVLAIVKANPLTLLVKVQDTEILPIHQAVSTGHIELVKIVLAHDPGHTYLETVKGKLPLHTSILERKVPISKLLLSHDIKCCKMKGSRAVPAKKKFLMRQRYDGKYPIHLACMRNAELVSWMLENYPSTDITTNAQDNMGNGCIHYAALVGDIDVMEILISRCSTLEDKLRLLCSKNSTGCSPLYVAASAGKIAVVNYILKHFPKAQAENRMALVSDILNVNPAYLPAIKDTYPFHIACQQRHYEVARRLLEVCPDACSLRRSDGIIGMNLAFKDSTTTVPINEDLIRLLLKHNPQAILHRDKLSPFLTPLEAISSLNTMPKAPKRVRPFAEGNCLRVMLRCALDHLSKNEQRSEWESKLRESNWQWRKQAMMIGRSFELRLREHPNILSMVYVTNTDCFRHIVSFI
jgi:ankyrin repeat protein